MKRSLLVGIGAVALTAATVLGYTVTSQASPSRSQHSPQAQQPVPPARDAVIVPSVGEDTFVSLKPCRIVDTSAGGGAIVSGATRTVQAAGTTGFTGQGGTSGGCGVPAAAVAVSLSVTATGATNTGHITAYRAGTTTPPGRTVSYPKTTTVTASSTVQLGSGQLSLYNHGGTVQVTVDVIGYLAQPIHATIAPDGTIYASTSRVLSVTHNSTGFYTVLTDRNLSGCSVSASIRGGNYYVSAFAGTGNSVTVSTWAVNSSAAVVPTDLYYDLTVTC